MGELEQYYQCGPVFIWWDNNELYGKVYISLEKGYMPLNFKKEDLDLVSKCDSLLTKLMEGYILYINNNSAYLGTKQVNELYNNIELFNTIYSKQGDNIYELIIGLDKKINDNKYSTKRLIKNGMEYYE